jgi:hypothetical protein
VQTVNVWKVFVASSVASLTAIAVAVYMGLQTHRDIVRSEWVTEINAAIAAGKLAPSADGGLCAYENKKWVRLDK